MSICVTDRSYTRGHVLGVGEELPEWCCWGNCTDCSLVEAVCCNLTPATSPGIEQWRGWARHWYGRSRGSGWLASCRQTIAKNYLNLYSFWRWKLDFWTRNLSFWDIWPNFMWNSKINLHCMIGTCHAQSWHRRYNLYPGQKFLIIHGFSVGNIETLTIDILAKIFKGAGRSDRGDYAPLASKLATWLPHVLKTLLPRHSTSVLSSTMHWRGTLL